MLKKVFITGESGNLGFLIKRDLLNKGYSVINNSYLEFASHQKNSLPNIFYYEYQPEIDIRDYELIDKIISESKPDIVIHTAAYVGTDKCELDTVGAYDTNFLAIENLCSTIKKYVPDCLFVNFSTTATMNPSEYSLDNLITELTPREPKTFYGVTKLLGERYIKNNMNRYINFLPVFLFGPYPQDNASIWAKIFYGTLQGKTFDIKLDTKYHKQYEYVDNVIEVLNRIIINKEAVNKDIVISGNERQEFLYFLGTANYEFEAITGKKILYTLHPEEDYLKHHVADPSLMFKLSGISEEEYNKNRKDFRTAIVEVIKSCL